MRCVNCAFVHVLDKVVGLTATLARLRHWQRTRTLTQSREGGEAGKQVQALLELVLYYTSMQAYVTALEMAQQAREALSNFSAEDHASVDRVSLAQLQDVIATYLHLNNDLDAARVFYRDALKVRGSVGVPAGTRHH